MTKTESRIIDTLALLSFALTEKNKQISEHHLEDLICGQEFYLPDGCYSRIIVSELSGRASLTSNSREQVKEAWGRCKELISDLEKLVAKARTNRNQFKSRQKVTNGGSNGKL